jgi:hypothetical protein
MTFNCELLHIFMAVINEICSLEVVVIDINYPLTIFFCSFRSHRGLYPFGEYISYTNHSFTIHEIKHLWRKHHCARTYGRDLNIRVDIFENPLETNVLCSDWNSWKDPIIWLVLQLLPRISSWHDLDMFLL